MQAAMGAYFGHVWLVRLIIQRGLAAVYVVAFANVVREFPALLGEHGLLPVPAFTRRARFLETPSLFHWHYSDRLARAVGWAGIVLALVALSGVGESGPVWVPILLWLVLWFLYLSVVNVGQAFYGFGWESMLLEAGFFAAFLGPGWMRAPLVPVLILRWMLFRTELGAGLIKLRGDPCWRDLTCLYYHYETQPLPNPLSRRFHRMPRWMHRRAVLFSHFVQVVVPFGLFAPQPVAAVCGGLIIVQQLLLTVSGNYSWLNWLTVVLGVSAFSDATLGFRSPATRAAPMAMLIVWAALAVFTVIASIEPVRNLVSSRQAMNRSYNPLHLVGSYGAFGSVTKERYEIVLEATRDAVLSESTEWREYEFRAKPGDPRRRPPQVAPYHLRLDWLMWFLPFSVRVQQGQLWMPGYEFWFLRLAQRLLTADAATLRLLRSAPLGTERPAFVRALYYRYRFSTREPARGEGAWWTRELVGTYLPPMSERALARLT
ncbi:MAG: lipase maturation factor family protein [Terriglobales bacterium]